MTAKDFLEDLGMYDAYTEDVVLKYARLKCQELLSLVAKKSKVFTKKDGANEKYLSIEGDWIVIDKDSILNAVDLDEFII